MTTNTKTDHATVNVGDLKQMLIDAARTAGTDTSLPMLAGVLLHTAPKGNGTVLVATATDRYTLGQVHADATGELGETFVPLADVKRAVKALALVDPAGLAGLSITDGALAVAARGLILELETAKPHEALTKTSKLFGTSNRSDEQRIAVNAEMLARFVPIAKARGIGQNTIIVEVLGKARPIHVHIGDSYRAMVMPVRLGEQHADVPLFLTPTEQAAADKAASDAAEAKAKRSAAAKKAAATRAARRAGTAPAAPKTSRRPATRKKAA